MAAAREPHVALLRNVNVGQRGHPSTDDLLSAFAAAGATHAVSFQSNGTPLVEHVLSIPATLRGLPTLVRLSEKFGSGVG
jgi:uncharacterized protein (DUF1697 family)